jgi:hypothetical protein
MLNDDYSVCRSEERLEGLYPRASENLSPWLTDLTAPLVGVGYQLFLIANRFPITLYTLRHLTPTQIKPRQAILRLKSRATSGARTVSQRKAESCFSILTL